MRARLTYSTLRVGLTVLAFLVLTGAIVGGAVFFRQRETPRYCQLQQSPGGRNATRSITLASRTFGSTGNASMAIRQAS